MNGIDPALISQIQESLGRSLQTSEYDLVDVVPIPASGDRMVRLRTIEEALQDFDGYLVQIRPRRKTEVSLEPAMDHGSGAISAGEATFARTGTAGQGLQGQEAIYRGDGKLNTPFLLKNAELLYSCGDYPLARNIYKAIVQSGERTAAALHGMGRCYEAEGKLEEARIQYEESIAYQPGLEVYQHLASLLIHQQKDQAAAEVLERALNLKEIPNRTRFEFHKAAGNCWTRVHRAAEAEKHYIRALEVDPSAGDIRANLGALCLQAGKVPEAKKHFQDAIASNPRNHRAYTGLGSCFNAEGDKRAAHDAFAHALEIDLNNANAIFYLVKCAYEIRSYATAARLLEEYVQIAPVNVNLLYSLAGLQFHLGRIETARATCKKILELAPGHAGTAELLTMMERFAQND